ncbi:phloretin 2'-O-glucosyltransferase-like [Lolium perenne]|uniref:phloretin 2'-O-glucosyltransferase-like n=1 Tax=Lolium perenne TaxID=4522 RepID=UPI0021EB37FB|nr:phloretin 2'-O-glucosyltransferase-like [Lolium perenne]
MDAAATTMAPRKLVVLYPSPGMGHIVSMIELGKIFVARGLAVSIVVIDLPHNTGSSATGPFLAGVTAANPCISFHRLPQVKLPHVESRHIETLNFEVARAANPHLRDFLVSISPDIFIADFFCHVARHVASELGIPVYFFFTSGAEVLAVLLHLPVMHSKTTANFQDMGEELVHVPGIPSFPASHAMLPILDRDDAAYMAFVNVCSDMCRSQGIIANTFRSLEPRAIEAIVAGLCTPVGLPIPPVYCIGPLIKSEELGVKRGDECIAWLDTQPKDSVVFLCFGSLGRFSVKQIREVALGLEASGQRFLWVVKSPPNDDPTKKFENPSEPDLVALLSEGFLDRTKDTGLVVKSWAPQRDVLMHDAVGGFVTHCGWNSVLESIMAGVPMLAWPLYAEQRMNRMFLEKELGLAVAVEGYDKEVVEAGEVAAKVKWMMDSDGGRVSRERTQAAMRQAKKAISQGGESEKTLTGLVEAWILA